MNNSEKRAKISEDAAKVRSQIESWPEWMPKTLGPIPSAPKFPPKIDNETLRRTSAMILADWIDSGKISGDENIKNAVPEAVKEAKKLIGAVDDFLK
jgi:hypothetical protein